MAPKSVMKKKLQLKKKKPTKKVPKLVSKPVEIDSDNDDSDGSLDAIEFDSK